MCPTLQKYIFSDFWININVTQSFTNWNLMQSPSHVLSLPTQGQCCSWLQEPKRPQLCLILAST
jgi:hypothetical protein